MRGADGACQGRRLVRRVSLYFAPNVPAAAQFGKKAAQTIERARRAGGSARPASSDPEPVSAAVPRSLETLGNAVPQAGTRPSRCRRSAEALRRRTERRSGGVRRSSARRDDTGCTGSLRRALQAVTPSSAIWRWQRSSRTPRLQEPPAVNLGASAGLPGVAQFKKRFGGIDVPVIEHRSTALSLSRSPADSSSAHTCSSRALNDARDRASRGTGDDPSSGGS